MYNMSNNNSSILCWRPDWFWKLGDNVNFAQFIILPFYSIVGTLGHALCAAVFLKEAKNEKAYVYQIFLEIAGCLENILFTLYLLAFLGSGIFGDGYEWYQKSYFLMWYAAHLALPLLHSMSVTCLLINVCMAADRAIAIMKPFSYKNINRKRNQILSLVFSIILSFCATFFDVRLFEVSKNSESHFVLAVDLDFVGTLPSIILSHICNGIRMLGLLALIVNNVNIFRYYKKHIAQMQKSSVNKKNHEAKEKSLEKSLLLLTITQSIFTAVTMFSYVVFYTAAYTVPLFNECDKVVYAPLLNIVVMICDVSKTCVIVAMNSKGRKILLNVLLFVKNFKPVKISIVQTTITSTIATRY